MNYEGTDNYGRPKSDYLAKLTAMNDEALRSECHQMIYHAARCANNPRADWHWMVDACYDESAKRGGAIYSEAFDSCYAEHAG
jgi:hypothetical protein